MTISSIDKHITVTITRYATKYVSWPKQYYEERHACSIIIFTFSTGLQPITLRSQNPDPESNLGHHYTRPPIQPLYLQSSSLHLDQAQRVNTHNIHPCNDRSVSLVNDRSSPLMAIIEHSKYGHKSLEQRCGF